MPPAGRTAVREIGIPELSFRMEMILGDRLPIAGTLSGMRGRARLPIECGLGRGHRVSVVWRNRPDAGSPSAAAG